MESSVTKMEPPSVQRCLRNGFGNNNVDYDHSFVDSFVSRISIRSFRGLAEEGRDNEACED